MHVAHDDPDQRDLGGRGVPDDGDDLASRPAPTLDLHIEPADSEVPGTLRRCPGGGRVGRDGRFPCCRPGGVRDEHLITNDERDLQEQ